MKLLWGKKAWADYLYWQTQDKKTLNKINKILEDIQRNPFHGIGKPEPLRNSNKGAWSRRIDKKNRITYRVQETYIEIIECRGHYD